MDKTQAGTTAALGAALGLNVGHVVEVDRAGLAGAQHTNLIRLHAPEREQPDEQLHIEPGDVAAWLFWKTSDMLPASMAIQQVVVARRDAHDNFLGWLIQQNS